MGRGFVMTKIRSMKQVLIVNGALFLPSGKMAAQAAHASVAAFLKAGPASRKAWLDAGMPKIVLEAQDAAQLGDLFHRAAAANLPAYLVRDAGRTIIAAGTVTCLGIGPAPTKDIDPLTGMLPLMK